MNGYVNWMMALLVLVSGLIACVQGGPDPCANLPQIPPCAKSCFLSAGKSLDCDAKDTDCQCGSFKAHAADSVDQQCILDACPNGGSMALSIAIQVCKCRPSIAPELEFPDAEDSPSTTAEDPPSTTTESPPSTTSERHRFFRHMLDRVPFAHPVAHAFKHLFRHGG